MAERMKGLKIGSNTDKDGTGCTNLAHRHFQCGGYDYAVSFYFFLIITLLIIINRYQSY